MKAHGFGWMYWQNCSLSAVMHFWGNPCLNTGHLSISPVSSNNKTPICILSIIETPDTYLQTKYNAFTRHLSSSPVSSNHETPLSISPVSCNHQTPIYFLSIMQQSDTYPHPQCHPTIRHLSTSLVSSNHQTPIHIPSIMQPPDKMNLCSSNHLAIQAG